MSINVCIPTLNAIDEFWKCIDSVVNSSVSCNIFVVDNGGLVDDSSTTKFMVVHKPLSNLGVAGSWNFMIDHTPEIRIITNDDVIFDKYAIEIMVTQYYSDRANGICNLVSPVNIGTPFSCYLLPQEVIEKVGKFDEWISPKYAYFEDDDYSYRMSMAGVGITKADMCYVEHTGSSTLRHFDKQKEREHHDKFRLARSHYVKKWGGEPHQEKYKTPFGQ
jgi:GT2 family glycosyltransferase